MSDTIRKRDRKREMLNRYFEMVSVQISLLFLETMQSLIVVRVYGICIVLNSYGATILEIGFDWMEMRFTWFSRTHINFIQSYSVSEYCVTMPSLHLNQAIPRSSFSFLFFTKKYVGAKTRCDIYMKNGKSD